MDAARQYGHDWTPEMFNDDGSENEHFDDELEADCLYWLKDKTQVIEFDGGVVISNF